MSVYFVFHWFSAIELCDWFVPSIHFLSFNSHKWQRTSIATAKSIGEIAMEKNRLQCATMRLMWDRTVWCKPGPCKTRKFLTIYYSIESNEKDLIRFLLMARNWYTVRECGMNSSNPKIVLTNWWWWWR